MAYSFPFEHWMFEEKNKSYWKLGRRGFILSTHLFSVYYLPLTIGLDSGNIAL